MRMIIKNADFENVSIGKVARDLSFVENFPIRPDFFKNVDSSWNATEIATYIVNDKDNPTSCILGGGTYRAQTDLIEVMPGMRITTTNEWKTDNANNAIVTIACFNSSKQLVSNAYLFRLSGLYQIDFTVPSGVYYVVLQASTNQKNVTTGQLIFSMPDD